MPTHEEFTQFMREYLSLTPAQRRKFGKAVAKMVLDPRAGAPFRPSLRVKGVQGHVGVFEVTWDEGNGMRTTFHYGPEQQPGEVHIVWRRIGGYDIFGNP